MTVVKLVFCECKCESQCRACFMGMLRIVFIMGGAGRVVWFHVVEHNYDYPRIYGISNT